jgi:hypothetical protein
VNKELHCSLLTQKDYKYAKPADHKTTLHCNTETRNVIAVGGAENYCENY